VRITVIVLLVLWLAASADAAWTPARVLDSNSAPRVAVEDIGGGVSVLAGSGQAARFSWAPGSRAAVRTVLADPFKGVNREQRWAVNRRGDAVLVRQLDERAFSVLAIDASGRRSATKVDVGVDQSLGEIRVAVAADGTSAVAWTQLDRRRGGVTSRPFLSIRLRAANGSFRPTIELPGPGPVGVFAVTAADAMRVVAAYASQVEDEVVTRYAEVGPTDPPLVETVMTATLQPQSYPLIDVSTGRVLTQVGVGHLSALARTWAGNWSAPQVIASDVSAARLTALPDGRALVGFARGGGAFVARAQPGAPFEPASRVGSAARRWAVDAIALSVDASGDALLVWHEWIDPTVCNVDSCVTRIVAAIASADGQFGRPERVSSLGSVNESFQPIAAAHSSRGESVIAWEDWTGRLIAARGDARPGPSPEPPDGQGPRVRASARLASLRAAVHGARLSARVRCDEPCAVTLSMWNPRAFWSLYELEPVVVLHAGAKSAHWRLSKDERRELRGLLRAAGRPTLTALAIDASGNLRATNAHVSD
jgi:hypothetical protein